jgi:uncharacterized protein
MKCSRYVVASPTIQTDAAASVKRVIFSTRTSTTILLDEAGWQALTAGHPERLPDSLMEELVRAEILVTEDEDELDVILRRNKAAIQDEHSLYMVVQPSAACQLGCGYCGQQHSAVSMSRSIQDAWLARVDRKLAGNRYDALQIGWFGAEPLTAMPVVRRLTSELQNRTDARRMRYSAKVVTNGVALTAETATELVRQLGVTSIEVTLDGPRHHHDARRHTKSGARSFDRIFANLVAIRDLDLSFALSIRCNVDRTNADGVGELIDLLSEHGLHKRASFYTAPVHSWGNDAHIASLSREDYAAREIEWLALQISRGFKLSLVPSRRTSVCLAVDEESEVVDAHGEVFNCTEVPYVPAYGTPNVFGLGRVADDRPTARHFNDFADRIADGTYPCQTCPMLPTCGGACPKLWHEGLVPCPSTKLNIGERLLLVLARDRMRGQGDGHAEA